MVDYRLALISATVLLGIGVVAAMIFFRGSNHELAPAAPTSPGQRLAVLARQRPDYQMLVGVPPALPTAWATVSRVVEGHLTVESHGDIVLEEVKAFIVAYPNGQVVDCELAGLPLPPMMSGLQPGRNREKNILRLTDLKEGQKYIQVKYGRSGVQPHDRSHYSTTLTNISEQRIRVLRFAGYTKGPEGWRLNTVTGTFYSAEEFWNWYELGQKEWIGPGESVTDPNNYGSPPMLWVYFCQAEDGKEFIAGKVLE
jgi:hypothetical protein